MPMADGSASDLRTNPRLPSQRYLPNTNILGDSIRPAQRKLPRVLDFAPRFMQHERTFRPTQLHRIVEPISGTPRIRILCQPRAAGWSKEQPTRVYGSHHVSFEGYASHLRLTTDLPVSYLEGQPFTLTDRRHVVLTWGDAIEEPLAPLL